MPYYRRFEFLEQMREELNALLGDEPSSPDRLYEERLAVLRKLLASGAIESPSDVVTFDGSHWNFRLPAKGFSIESLEKRMFFLVLTHTHFNFARAASLVGMTYRSFIYKARKFGFHPKTPLEAVPQKSA